MKIVILGGYGNFGARISRALAHTPGMDLIIAGRSAERSRDMAQQCGAAAAVLDVDDPALAQQLLKLGAGMVIHTAGPFQSQSYSVAQAAAAAQAHYIDLADGRRFVCDFPAALDELFRCQGCTAFTGASTVPALSSAVVDHLAQGWRSITDIDCCIAPAQTAPRGVATMAAVLGYCGAPVQVWQDGRWETQYGWSAPAKVEFARLRPRLGSLCDIPDLELFPARYPGVQNVMFRAALELGVSQRGMAVLASLRRRGLLSKPERIAGFLNRAADGLDMFGSALGAMVVRVRGTDGGGAPASAAWHIAADDDHGPEIPCMAAIVLARRLAAGEIRQAGAFTTAGQLALAEFEPEFRKWDMQTDIQR
ncbi:saccharopine dehydrogenase NADP-binding domain-containing protein [Massilia sp. PAMC28688]|uniref:saccharopine dehydrogenase family protein n=1 Tax=Massilia sp. PAMC28688 TaxID=2861283 RepID=UPI001C62D684|nr:saccharopine dehydrogenase NADP-binding domain-containing protein [Massilia sp. PAMC28688]QYF95798.1 saccharopine dehydrogenase NADP-binding domain-containing protein [Massilia sp. PAMC28688]